MVFGDFTVWLYFSIIQCFAERRGHLASVIRTSGCCMKELEQVTLWESERSWRMLERSRLISCLQLLEIPWVSKAALLLGWFFSPLN